MIKGLWAEGMANTEVLKWAHACFKKGKAAEGECKLVVSTNNTHPRYKMNYLWE